MAAAVTAVTARRGAPAIAIAIAAAWLGACGAGDFGPGDDDGGMDGGSCSTFVTFEPAPPIASASAQVRVNANVTGAPGVLQYAWTVAFEGAFVPTTLAQPDGSAITFPAARPGVYFVGLQVGGGGATSCPTVDEELNVLAANARETELRLRITPAAGSNVPPFERVIPVRGGADFSLGKLSLDAGVTATATVRSGGSGGAGAPAYLKLMPVAAREAAVEAFAGAMGGFSARVLGQPHDVLVIPTAPGLAPRLVRDWSPSNPTIPVGAGMTVNGTVLGPGGGLAGAKVQLKIGGVPSTLATTAVGGDFSLLVEPRPGEVISVDVTPPDGSGLPRLSAQSPTAFDLTQRLEIAYPAPFPVRDLGGATVRRQGAPVAGAKVIVVGTIASAGTVRAGGAMVSASGTVRIAATANGAGVLPSVLAPARPLSAVVEVAPSDHAVAAIDLTSAPPASIDAPPAVAIATQLRQPDGTPVSGVVLDAVPVGPLALAGVTSSVRARSGTGGGVAASLAAGGRYDLRIHDPVLVRGAPRIVRGVTAASIAASYALVPEITAIGRLLLQGSPTPLGGAVIQLLCSECSGLERSLPLAEVTSRPDGRFTIVVPDPGTN